MKMQLSALRVNTGLSQETVAKELHISKRTLGMLEHYAASPTVTQRKQMCDLYGCTPNDVFIGILFQGVRYIKSIGGTGDCVIADFIHNNKPPLEVVAADWTMRGC